MTLQEPTVDREGNTFVLRMSQWLPLSPPELFPFFADAHNLEQITPPLLRFHVLTPAPIDMHVGTLIDYKLRVRGMPIRWRTVITGWDPPAGFRDEQLKGPYKLWRHTHTFDPADGGTLCRDRVDYRVPGGPLAPLVNRLLVERDVKEIFRFRARALESIFGRGRTDKPRPARQDA